MYKIIVSVIISFLLISCDQKNHNGIIYPSDNPAERVIWERMRLVNPATGEVPRDIRRKEMAFAKTLPKSSSMHKSVWKHRGPYNVGGRTRALCFDILDENDAPAGNYRLRFDFFTDYFRQIETTEGTIGDAFDDYDDVRFIVSEVSPSRTEILIKPVKKRSFREDFQTNLEFVHFANKEITDDTSEKEHLGIKVGITDVVANH